MNDIILQTLYFMASYAGLIAIILFVSNFMTKGFFFTYLRVKASRGKKLLVEVSGIDTDYYRIGSFHGKEFKFTDKTGEGHICTDLKREDIKHKLGVSCIEYDLPSGNIIRLGQPRPSCDPISVDDFHNRVLMAPRFGDDKLKKIMFFMLIGALLLGVIAIGFSYNNMTLIQGLKLAGVIV